MTINSGVMNLLFLLSSFTKAKYFSLTDVSSDSANRENSHQARTLVLFLKDTVVYLARAKSQEDDDIPRYADLQQ